MRRGMPKESTESAAAIAAKSVRKRTAQTEAAIQEAAKSQLKNKYS